MHKHIALLHTTKPNDPNDPSGIREYYQKVIDAMPNNVYWLNRDCITMGCNRNTLDVIGLSRLEDFVGITYEEMGKLANWTEGQALSFKRDDMEVMSTGKAKYNVEEPPIYDSQGNPRYYLSSRVPLFDEEQNVIGVIGISVDITEKKKLEAEVQEMRVREERLKVLSSIGGMIAHELKTPLTAIQLGISTLKEYFPFFLSIYKQWAKDKDELPISEMRFAPLEKICDELSIASDEMENKIDTILAGFKPLDRSKLEIITLDKILKTFISSHPLTEEEKSHITLKPLSQQKIIGNQQIISHVLSNLLKNALYAIKEVNKGEITISSSESDDKVFLHFKDTAKGIPEDQINKIFEPFYTTKSSATSIGMGLYFCKLALEQINAQITCKSVEKEYTIFTLVLPKGTSEVT